MEQELKISEEKKIKKGYDFLRELCSFNADFNAFGGGNVNPITNRVQYIMHQLDTHNIKYTIDKFQPIAKTPDFVQGEKAFVNIVVEIEGIDTTKATLFCAHHDTVNMESENCQDNTASIANLLDLSIRLSKDKPLTNVVIVFNDAEEIVAPTICGSQRIAQNIINGKYGQVVGCFALELSANGKKYWMSYNKNENTLAHIVREKFATEPQNIVHRVRTPYNDSFVIEREGIPSVCIGSLRDGDMNNVLTRGFCSTWALCHSMNDTFEHSAVEEDMDEFVNFLVKLI